MILDTGQRALICAGFFVLPLRLATSPKPISFIRAALSPAPPGRSGAGDRRWQFCGSASGRHYGERRARVGSTFAPTNRALTSRAAYGRLPAASCKTSGFVGVVAVRSHEHLDGVPENASELTASRAFGSRQR